MLYALYWPKVERRKPGRRRGRERGSAGRRGQGEPGEGEHQPTHISSRGRGLHPGGGSSRTNMQSPWKK